MSARDTILLALTRYYEKNADPRGTASQVLTGYDNDRRDDLLRQRADVRDRMLGDARAAGRAEALVEADLLPKADVVTWLTKKAREIPRGNKIGRAQGDVLAVMASKVARGAVRPDNLRMLPPDFYEVGRTYTDPSADYDWKFRVDAVTTHPQTGERMALGWRHFRGEWAEMAYGEDSFEIHLIAGMTDGGGQ